MLAGSSRRSSIHGAGPSMMRLPVSESCSRCRAPERVPCAWARQPHLGCMTDLPRALLSGRFRSTKAFSPHKGYRCAYNDHTGCASCSRLGARAIRWRGLLGLALLVRPFGRCHDVFKLYREKGMPGPARLRRQSIAGRRPRRHRSTYERMCNYAGPRSPPIGVAGHRHFSRCS
jgi:hypothetical protein